MTFAQLLPWVLAGVCLLGLVATFIKIRRADTGGWLYAGWGMALLVAGYATATNLRWLGDDYFRFDRPWAAFLAVLGTLLAVALLARQGRSRAMGRGRRITSDTLAWLLALLLGLVFAGPSLGRPLDRLAVIVVVDRSRSIDLVPQAEERIARELDIAELDMRERDRIGVIAFGTSAHVEEPLRNKAETRTPGQVEIGRDATDLEGAIRRALGEVPSDSAARVVLLSDGVATRGDAMRGAAAAVAAEVPIDVVVLEQRERPDIRVVALRMPPRIDAGAAMDLSIVTASQHPAEVEVRISRDGELIRKARGSIAAGEDVLRVRQVEDEPGLHRYDVEITALDPSLDEAPEDNQQSAFVRVRGKARALVLDGEAGQAAFIESALSQGGFTVDVGTATRVPGDLGTLAAYDLVVFSDIAAPKLDPGQIALLASYVRDLGGGLWLLGGDQSLGPGGYSKTPIEEVSPLSFDLKQDRRRASLAEVIAIDISGSMGANVGGHTKLELANEAAARSAALLGAGDKLGVIHTDTINNWSVPLAPVDDKDAIDKAIRSVGPGGGGILCDVALPEAYRALDKVDTNLKHVLLFADGGDAEGLPTVKPLAEQAMRRGITTSVVALGDGQHVPDLEQLSRIAGGRFYLIEDANRLPAVFAQETILAARSAISEDPFAVDLIAPDGPVVGIPWSEAPDLAGYVVTIPKARADVHLTGPEGDPILATWSVGVGRTAVFTSDLKSRWGSAWTHWEGAAKMVVQVARDIARQGDDRKVRLEADTSGGVLHLRADVVGEDGRADSFRRMLVHVAGPDGFSHEVPLEAVSAGAYAASVPLERPGTYVAVARDEVTGDPVATTGGVLTAGEELRPTGSDIGALERIAEFTGGKRRDTLAGIFGDRATKRFAYDPLTSILLAASAVMLLTMVGARRLAVPEFVDRWIAALRRRRQLRRSLAKNERAGMATQTVQKLISAREKRAVEMADQAGKAGAKGKPHPSLPPVQPPGAPGTHGPAPAPPRQPGWVAPPGYAPGPPAAPPVRRPPPGAPAVPPGSAVSPPVTAATPQRTGAGPATPPDQGSPPPATTPEGRPMTAAEILLQKRRQKR